MKNYFPIIFKPDLVASIQLQSKTVTRRTNGLEKINKNPNQWELIVLVENTSSKNTYAVFRDKTEPGNPIWLDCPYGKPTSTLWVRETWQHTKILNISPDDENYSYVYKSDGYPWEDYKGWKWKPSIHMPKKACNLFLQVNNISIERLHDITKEQAIAEGVFKHVEDIMFPGSYRDYLNIENAFSCPIASFKTLWISINGADSWKHNPWVWVIDFKETKPPENFLKPIPNDKM